MTETADQKYRQEEYISRINRVIDFIETHLDEDLSLEHLADVAHFSRFYFHRIFKAIIGETLNQFIQRVRVEKAAVQLIGNPKKSITEIALDSGFSSSAAFARVFKEHFSVSASQWRLTPSKDHDKICQINDNNRQASGKNGKEPYSLTSHIDPLTNNYNWRINMTGTKDIKVEVKEMPDFHVAYVRHMGPYATDEELFKNLFEKLMRWVVPRNLFKPAESTFLSVYHDDPKITEEGKLRVSICMTVPEDTQVDGEVGKMVVPGGQFAVAHCEIKGDEYEEAWDSVMGSWMPSSGYQPDDRLCYEMNCNNPEEHPEKLHIVDICIPVKPL
jgi:AraC family transcriptional regulator